MRRVVRPERPGHRRAHPFYFPDHRDGGTVVQLVLRVQQSPPILVSVGGIKVH